MSVKLLKQNAVSNPNLLINGDFQVWQRGTTFNSISSFIYTADRWRVIDNTVKHTIQKDANGMKIVTAGQLLIAQYIEKSRILIDKPISISAMFNGKIYKYEGYTVTTAFNGVALKAEDGTSEVSVSVKNTSDYYEVDAYICKNGDTKTNKILSYIKVEIGGYCTKQVPRPYAEELSMCSRYFRYETVTGVLYRQDSGYNYYRLVTNNRFRIVPNTNWISADIPYVGDVPIYTSTAINDKGEGVVLILTAKAGTSNIVLVTVQYDAEIY